jgi:hypothetical protein
MQGAFGACSEPFDFGPLTEAPMVRLPVIVTAPTIFASKGALKTRRFAARYAPQLYGGNQTCAPPDLQSPGEGQLIFSLFLELICLIRMFPWCLSLKSGKGDETDVRHAV